ncbi:MAG: hypothetical protein JXB18_08625 [Sedimentisphaerales bacterium]|nr:hypothetical protein [Sedimentisphaerales bacterium]
MKKVCFLTAGLMTFLLAFNSIAQADRTVSVKASQGKAADWRTPDTVMGNTTQLMTRSVSGSNDCKKSWLQFDLSSLYAEDSSVPGNILDARLTFYGGKSETGAKSYVVSGLNDVAGLEEWVAAALTWNNGPGNDINSGTGLIASQTTTLYSTSIPVPVLDVMSETPEASRTALAAFLNTDTDGKITFVFTAGSTTYLWNAGQPLEPVLTLTYVLGKNPDKAHNPNPADEAIVETDLASLSWINPEPNSPGGIMICDVYLGVEPNLMTMDKKTLAAGAASVAINTTNFPKYGILDNQKTYYWKVDVHDSSSPDVIDGQIWSFFTNDNAAPIVDAGPDQVAWLGKSGTPGQDILLLDGTTSDDGLPTSTYTVAWSQLSGPAITISPDNTEDTTVTITARGTYVFELKADDGNRQTVDTVQIIVGDDSCDASHLSTGQPYDAGDQNQDCIVNLQDFAVLISANWLDCTDTLTDCTK